MTKKTTAVLIFPVAPMGAPRQTQRDRWMRRPVITRYHDLRDQIVWLARNYRYTLSDQLTIRFFLTMPASWSRKKAAQMDGQPHQQKPDVDNLIKTWCDAFQEDDAFVWHVDATKYWTSKEGFIEVEV